MQGINCKICLSEVMLLFLPGVSSYPSWLVRSNAHFEKKVEIYTDPWVLFPAQENRNGTWAQGYVKSKLIHEIVYGEQAFCILPIRSVKNVGVFFVPLIQDKVSNICRTISLDHYGYLVLYYSKSICQQSLKGKFTVIYLRISWTDILFLVLS